MALELTLAREMAGVASLTASAGRATRESDAPVGPTTPVLMDLPLLTEGEASAPVVRLAAGGGVGWRRAEVSRSLDDGASWSSAGRTALPATMGHVVTPPGAGPLELVDRRNKIEVELLNSALSLVSVTDDALIAGGNLALCGEELIQFRTAVQLSATRWRLSDLLRGRRGSDWAIGAHVAGEPFVLLEAASLLAIDVPLSAIGTIVRVSAIGPGDAGIAAQASLAIGGDAVRPPAPVGITAERLADGTIRFGWIRRARGGWLWMDGSDAPPGEDGERYRLTITLGGGGGRTILIDAATYDYAPVEQAADGLTAAVGSIAIEQIGARATSRPATFGWAF